MAENSPRRERVRIIERDTGAGVMATVAIILAAILLFLVFFRDEPPAVPDTGDTAPATEEPVVPNTEIRNEWRVETQTETRQETERMRELFE